MPPSLWILAGLTVVAAVVGWVTWRTKPYGEMPRLGRAVTCAAVTGFLVAFTLTLVSAVTPSSYGHGCWNTPLVALGSNSATGGSFFLGSGMLYDEPTYEFLWNDGTGRIFEGHVAADGSQSGPVSVIEEERTGGYLRQCPANLEGWHRWVAFTSSNVGSNAYEFHIPVGSVRRTFNVGVGQ